MLRPHRRGLVVVIPRRRRLKPRALTFEQKRPRCRCGTPLIAGRCWDCDSCTLAESLHGLATLWAESHGCSVLDCLIAAEDQIAGESWHTVGGRIAAAGRYHEVIKTRAYRDTGPETESTS